MKQDIFFFNTWYRGHNNVRYAELLPRLDRVHGSLRPFRARVSCVSRLSARGGERAGALEPAILRRAQMRFPYAFVTGLDQLDSLTVPAVVDVDDPRFEQDALLLERPNVAAYVVTDESAARTFEQLGVTRPWHVIPQGVALDKLDPGEVERVARKDRSDGAPVAGYVAAFLLLPGDRGGDNPLYDVSHLLDLWDEVVKRRPDARLWLAGAPSARLRERLSDRRDILLTGRLSPEQLLARVANLDVALYPRVADQGVRAVKIAEYLGLGVPSSPTTGRSSPTCERHGPACSSRRRRSSSERSLACSASRRSESRSLQPHVPPGRSGTGGCSRAVTPRFSTSTCRLT